MDFLMAVKRSNMMTNVRITFVLYRTYNGRRVRTYSKVPTQSIRFQTQPVSLHSEDFSESCNVYTNKWWYLCNC